MLKVSYIINTVFTSRTYIIRAEGYTECWLVDCGDVAPLEERLLTEGSVPLSVKGVLLTHSHYDHIYGLPGLTELYPDVKVYTNGYGKKSLANERINMSRYHEDPINYESDNVIVCDEGSVINLFEGVDALVHFTPGHNPSCLCFEVGDYLFTGDAYIPGVEVVTNLPGSDKVLAKQSEEKIGLLAEGKTVCPGHELPQENEGRESRFIF